MSGRSGQECRLAAASEVEVAETCLAGVPASEVEVAGVRRVWQECQRLRS